MEEIYLGFTSKRDVEKNFHTKLANNAQILFAQYEDGGYSGSAWVIFHEDNKLYEVHGSHCSCYGLENQWEPELTTKEELLARITRGGQKNYDINSVKKVLEQWNNIIVLEDFDFNNLPTPEQIKDSISVVQLLKNKDIIMNEENTIKEVKNTIVNSIKQGAYQKLSEVSCLYTIELTKNAKQISYNHASEIEKAIVKIFDPTLSILREKKWQFTFSVDKNELNITIKLPFEPQLKKNSGYIKTI